jgi:hypothetical protein
VRVNVGCGPCPTPGWVNVDNSLSVALAKLPRMLSSALSRAGMIRPEQVNAIEVARRQGTVRGSGHRWMYDRDSLAKLVEEAGFDEIEILEPGETRIPEPGPLDLREREEGSIYLEAVRP